MLWGVSTRQLIATKDSDSTDLWKDTGTTYTVSVDCDGLCVIEAEVISDLSHTITVNGVSSPYVALSKSGSVNVTITGAHTGVVKDGTLNIYRIYGKCTATI